MKTLQRLTLLAILAFVPLWPGAARAQDLPFFAKTDFSSASFDPNSINDLVIAVDAKRSQDLTVTNAATLADGVSIRRWTNYATISEGRTNMIGNDTDGPANPNYLATGGPNGNPTLSLTNYSLQAWPYSVGKLFPSYPRTYMMVVQFNAPQSAAAGWLISHGEGTTYGTFELNQTQNALYRWNRYSGGWQAGPTTISTNWYVLTVTLTNYSLVIRTNGSTYWTNDIGDLTADYDRLQIGQSLSDGFVAKLQGCISRLWVWTRILSSAELTAAENACKSDYGL